MLRIDLLPIYRTNNSEYSDSPYDRVLCNRNACICYSRNYGRQHAGCCIGDLHTRNKRAGTESTFGVL